MWIAKPLGALTHSEQGQWKAIEQRIAPLSQTLCWARAIESVYGKPYLVFSPNEGVGGIVFCDSHPSLDELHFECINGPLLQWDDPQLISRQLATFATAVSRLDKRFSSLRISPRWEAGHTEQRLSFLPIELHSQTHAATLILSPKASTDQLLQSFAPRLQRTLKTAWKHGVQTRWESVTPEILEVFVPAMQEFGKAHDFVVPPLLWFQALTQEQEHLNSSSPTFWMASSVYDQAQTQIFVSILGDRAYYLFGHERRTPNMRAAISTSAAAQWEAVTQCFKLGVQSYDLNGYVVDANPSHPYSGVCRFKEQFGGKLVQYDVPEFLIQ